MKIAKIAIISDGSEALERIAAPFRRTREYLPILGLPQVIDDAGILLNACIRLSTALALSEIELVLYVGDPSNRIWTTLCQKLGRFKILSLQTFDVSFLSEIPGFCGKAVNVPLLIESEVTALDIVVVENNSLIDIEVARSVAMLMGAQVVVVPECSRDLLNETNELLRQWGYGSTPPAEQQAAEASLRAIVEGRLGKLINAKVKSLTFFTRGIPYGAFILQCASSHFFSIGASSGLCVLRSLLKMVGATELDIPVVVLCDPDNTGGSEFSELTRILGKEHGYILRKAFRENATPYEVRHLVEFMPSNMFIFTTHAGERKGELVTERFTTADGKAHTVIYESVLDFAGTMDPDRVEVNQFKRFVSLDGVDWNDNVGKVAINAGATIREYLRAIRHENYKADEVSRFPMQTTIRASNSLGMHSGAFNPALHDCGGQTYPLVFVNACSSWLEMAVRFSLAGASTYVGTSRDISNFIATDFAVKFISQVARGRAIGPALFYAQKGYMRDLGYCPYLMHGFIHSALRPSARKQNNLGRVIRRLENEINTWSKMKSAAVDEKMKDAHTRVHKFLLRELRLLVGKDNH